MIASSPLLSSFIDVLFPERCTSCSAILIDGESNICIGCESSLEYSKGGSQLVNKLRELAPIQSAESLYIFRTEGTIQKIIHQLKYNGRKELGSWLGRRLGDKIADNKHYYDVIIPIPIHNKKRVKRGYNQAELIAKGIKEVIGSEFDTATFKKVKNTVSQTSLDKEARLKNVSSSFQVVNPNALQNKSILLVDDVITSGATMAEAANTLLYSGVKSVSIAVVAEAGL